MLPKTYKFKGQWKGKSAGGCQNHPTWRYNPQLFLTVPEEKVVRVTLAQDPKEGGEALFQIGFYVAKADTPERRQLVIARSNLVCKAKFEVKEEVSAEMTLSPGVTYVVVPCTFNPGSEGGFTISFTSEGTVSLSPLPPSKEWKYISCAGTWDVRTSGGCRNHTSFDRNPQFLLRVRRSGDFTVLLSQSKEKFDAIGFYIVVVKESTEYAIVEVNSNDILTKSDFARPSEAIAVTQLDKKLHYVIIPCTFDPGFENDFKIEIFGDSDIRLRPLRSQKEVSVHGEWLGPSAGGCINHPTWRNNPQYFLFLKQTATLHVTLIQNESVGEHSIGFYIVKVCVCVLCVSFVCELECESVRV
jgi:uncharacterized lipoprotein NlpE involved in copper resistance